MEAGEKQAETQLKLNYEHEKFYNLYELFEKPTMVELLLRI